MITGPVHTVVRRIMTIPSPWGGTIPVALSLAAAALEDGIVAAHWLGWLSLGLGGLLTSVALIPLQHMVGLVALMWLPVASIMLVREVRR